MSEILDVQVQRDHLETITKSSGVNAIYELIWNSIDADAKEIRIIIEKDGLGGVKRVTLSDDGEGLKYTAAKDVFSKLGGSRKTIDKMSPGGRIYHGEKGSGRYKALGLGSLARFSSTFVKEDKFFQFDTILDRNKLSSPVVEDLVTLPKGDHHTGFVVQISNIDCKDVGKLLSAEEFRNSIAERFASTYLYYQDFKIFLNSVEINFNGLIRANQVFDESYSDESGEKHKVSFRIVEWNTDSVKRKTFLCGQNGSVYSDTSLGVRTSLNLTTFIQGGYIESLHNSSELDLGIEGDPLLQAIIKDARKFTREFATQRTHHKSREYIDNLKSRGIYPYKSVDPSELDSVETNKRRVFDIVALQIHNHLPSMDDQGDESLRLTFNLIKESLEHDSTALRDILEKVIGLSKEQQEELHELLESTSLSKIIGAMTMIKDRLNMIYGLEKLIYDKDISKNVLERKHLHKIIENETWLFGDQYILGTSDATLKSVLKEYLSHLGRDDFEEKIEEGEGKIPDICLWSQFSQNYRHKENLVIELKKPTVHAGTAELGQISDYASYVAQDSRFPKDKTSWTFILITREIKPVLEGRMNQHDRAYGHVFASDNYNVYVKTWGDILTAAKERHEYLKDKLNLAFESNEESLEYVKQKYKEYLPDELFQESNRSQN